jgi:hypothetical protein
VLLNGTNDDSVCDKVEKKLATVTLPKGSVEDRQRHIRHPLLYIGQACSHLIDHQLTLFQTTCFYQSTTQTRLRA